MKEFSDQSADSPTTRPTFVFPLGSALILLLVFAVSALFSCCYHWEKIRSMHNRHHYRRGGGGGVNSSSRSNSRANFSSPVTAPPNRISTPLQQSGRSLPVMMPGDDVPKFLAMPSPHAFAPQNMGGSAVESSHMKQSKQIFIRP